MSLCRVTAAVGCRKLLSGADKQMTASPEWVHLLPEADELFFFFLLFSLFWPLKKIWLDGVDFPLEQIFLVFWKLSKWANEPFYPVWVRFWKRKIKIAAWGAVLPPGMANPSEGRSAQWASPQLLLELVLLAFHLGCPSSDPCKAAVMTERKAGCHPNGKVLFLRRFAHGRDQFGDLTLPTS